jgi:excisionase family DNA binding protein
METKAKPPGAKGKGEVLEPLRWLTLRQAAEELQVSQASLRRAYYRGELQAFLIGASLRIRRADLDAYTGRNRWTPQLCAERTARPRAGRRKAKVIARPSACPTRDATPEC